MIPVDDATPPARSPSTGPLGPASAQGSQATRVRLGRQGRPTAGWRDQVLTARCAADVRRLDGLTPGTVHLLVLDHLLGDLEGAAVEALLRGVRRALAPGGLIRVYEDAPVADLAERVCRAGLVLDEAAALVPLAERSVVGQGACIAAMTLPGRAVDLAPRVSVLVDGSDPHAGAVLAGAAAQEDLDLEILLDAPAEVVQAVAAEDPRIRRGGLAEATGDVVVPLASGERLVPGALARLVTALTAFPDAVMACAWRPVLEPDGTPRATPRLAFEDVRLDGAGVVGLCLATGVDLAAGVGTVAVRAADLQAAVVPEVQVLHGLARTLALLGRGDCLWLADPVAGRLSGGALPSAAVRDDAERLVSEAVARGLWEPAAVPVLHPRRLRQRPWWDAGIRRRWIAGRVGLDPEERLEARLGLAAAAAEVEPTLDAVEALSEAGRGAEAARLAAEAVRRRPDVPGLTLAAAAALDRVGLVDDARFLRESAEQHGVVVVGRAGRDPRREPVRIETSWTGWVVTGGLPGSLTLVLGGDAGRSARVYRDGELLGDVVLDGGTVELGLDLDAAVLGHLVTIEADGAVLQRARVALPVAA